MGKPILRGRDNRIGGGLSESQLKSLLYKRLAWLMTPPRKVQGESTDSEHGRLVQQAILEVAGTLKRPGWSAYLVGGTLRDLLVGPGRQHQFVEPRDVDIVVSGAAREELRKLFEKRLVLERMTRFGGLHLIKPLASGDRVLFDIWTLADTWGFGAQKIPPRIEDFPVTTFLNIDSCAIELVEPEGRQRACFDQGFFASIVKRALDVNYAPNPYPYVCVARALVMAARLDFTITRKLAEFILTHTVAGGIDALIEAQVSHYGMVRCGAPELSIWIDGIRKQFSGGESAIRVKVSEARRVQLWRDYPAADDRAGQPPNQDLNSRVG
jgi:hypothetical protein